MNESPGRSQSESSALRGNRKRLGGHLIEAGLLTPAQVDVALNDQQATGMLFGEILVARGWVKRQTIEYLMKKVILPEEAALLEAERSVPRRNKSGQLLSSSSSTSTAAQPSPEGERSAAYRRDLPISKPLPASGSGEGGVSWVG
jgi:hypothetical protein